MTIIQTVKDHPYLTAGGVFVGGVILLFAFSSGTQSEEVSLGGYTGPDNSAAIAANNMLAQSQIAGQVASRMSDNERAARESDNETAYRIAEKSFEFQNNANVITSQIELGRVAGETERHRVTQNATVSIAQTQANRDKAVALAGVQRDQFIADKAAEVSRLQIMTEREVALHQANLAFDIRRADQFGETLGRLHQSHRDNLNNRLGLRV